MWVVFKGRPDWAISIESTNIFREKMEADTRVRETTMERRDTIKKGGYFMSCFAVSLRGGVRVSLWMHQA